MATSEERQMFGALITEARKNHPENPSRERLARMIEAQTGQHLTGTAVGYWEAGTNEPRDRRMVAAVDELLNLGGAGLSTLGYATGEPSMTLVKRDEFDALAERVQTLEATLGVRDKSAKPTPRRGGLHLAASSGDKADAKKITKAPTRKRPSPTEFSVTIRSRLDQSCCACSGDTLSGVAVFAGRDVLGRAWAERRPSRGPVVPSLATNTGRPAVPHVPPPRITLTGELDAANAANLRAQLAGAGPVSIDMAAVTFVDSTILDVLVRAAAAREVTVVAPSRIVRRVLEISGLDQVVTVEGP